MTAWNEKSAKSAVTCGQWLLNQRCPKKFKFVPEQENTTHFALKTGEVVLK
jgi:hypothetical protein